MAYELFDMEGCNLVGTYANQDVALLVVLETVRQSGEDAAETLSLGVPDLLGQTDGQLIAQGRALIELARSRFPAAAPAYA